MHVNDRRSSCKGCKYKIVKALELHTDAELFPSGYEWHNNPPVITLRLQVTGWLNWASLLSKSQITFVCSTSLSLINRTTSLIDWHALLVSVLSCFCSNIQFNHQLSTPAHTTAQCHPLSLCAITKSPFSCCSAGEQKKTEHLDIWFRGRNNNENA